MEHLSVDEIIEFVSMKEINDKNILLAKKVNGHIRECEECLKKVRSFQMIYDEMSKLEADKIASLFASNDNNVDVDLTTGIEK